MSDQPVARPLPKHRTIQTQNKHIHIQNIHVVCGIRTHDPGFRASEDNSCLRLLGYRDPPYFEEKMPVFIGYKLIMDELMKSEYA
jgi:hypothetical protein